MSIRYEILLAAVVLIPFALRLQDSLFQDMLPFAMILITFFALRGYGDVIQTADIHIVDMIAYEKSLFGGIIPAYYLQATLMPGALGTILIYVTSAFYTSHFFVPVITALILRSRAQAYYWPFVMGCLAITYIGFLIYFLYPAAPPWWATKYGFLVDQPVYLPTEWINMAALTSEIGPNEVAAMPSLHMSFPTYVTLFCLSVWGRRKAWVALLPLGVGFSTIFLGHHYVIDLLAGVLLATAVFSVVLALHTLRIQLPARRLLQRGSVLAKDGL